MRRYFKHFFWADAGATGIEYGLLAGLMAIAILVAVNTVGTALSAKLDQITGAFHENCDNSGLHDTFVVWRLGKRDVSDGQDARSCTQ